MSSHPLSSFVYFQRDCRVDKTNRRLSFAACLLIAVKVNEDLKALKKQDEMPSSAPSSAKKTNRLQSLIRPTKKVDSMFASLMTFFTQDWNISLKHLFAAEWGVFAALQFRLNAKPSHVAFHFKRLMKGLGWDPLRYLGGQMYGYWQQALVEEELQRIEHDKRIELRRKRREKKKLRQLERELEAANRREKSIRSATSEGSDDHQEVNSNAMMMNVNPIEEPRFATVPLKTDDLVEEKGESRAPTAKRRGSRHGLGDIFKLPLGSKRSQSTERGSLPLGSKRAQSSERGSERHWRSRHETTSTVVNDKPSVSVIAKEKTTKPAAKVETPLSPMKSSNVLRPLSKSKSMFARTSLEQDLNESETNTGTNRSGATRSKEVPSAEIVRNADKQHVDIDSNNGEEDEHGILI